MRGGMVGLATPTGRVHLSRVGVPSRTWNSWQERFIFLREKRLMAYYERRNSKVAKLRSCNGGFHNVGFDFSTFLPHNALCIARQLISVSFPVFLPFQAKKILVNGYTFSKAIFYFFNQIAKTMSLLSDARFILPGSCSISSKL